jgi:NADPH:quinone reductase-like Zn-dependent oxidoreductase
MASKGELLHAMKFVESGQIKPLVNRVLPLRDAAKAQSLMEEGKVMGKIVLVPERT